MGFSLQNSAENGCEEGHEGLKGSGQGAEEEGGRRRRKGQEEEVVEGQDEGQAQQPRPLRQGHLRQAHEGGPDVQAYHALDRVRADEGSRLAGQEGAPGAPYQGSHPTGREAPFPTDLHEGDEGGGGRGGEGGRKEEVKRPSLFSSVFPAVI